MKHLINRIWNKIMFWIPINVQIRLVSSGQSASVAVLEIMKSNYKVSASPSPGHLIYSPFSSQAYVEQFISKETLYILRMATHSSVQSEIASQPLISSSKLLLAQISISSWLSLSNKSSTFAFENRKNIFALALSPDGNVLISVDEGACFSSVSAYWFLNDLDGRALLVNAKRSVVLHHFNFHKPVKDIKFSPDGK